MAWSPSVEKLTRMNNKPTFSREVKLQWAGSRETVSTPVEAELFFLTSLFIELVENWPMWSMSVRRFIANYANFLVGEDTEIALFERCDRLQVGPPVGYFG